ncbi:hypothetical protein V757_01960 [Pelistega indica]|uniref:Uncharacterized protein n=1 Tax=Pelistega indica TaxID=1414851 RepID=V8GA50_9BURK|nr:hypothetical protein V757_01960 [Pelistega indica]
MFLNCTTDWVPWHQNGKPQNSEVFGNKKPLVAIKEYDKKMAKRGGKLMLKNV